MAIEGEWPLVGRAAELERLARRLGDGAGGVVLAGPAGVGKSRLAAECLALAQTHGCAPLRVAATQSSSGLPFGAFAPLLPDVAPGTDRTEMLRQMARTIVASGEPKRVALFIDDAHFLDENSATLTHQLAASERVFLLATLRSGEATSDAVVALWKEGLAERIEVDALSREEVEKLLGVVLGAPVDGATTRLLWERTQGNVLFLKEVVLAAQEAGLLRRDGGLWRLLGPLPASARLVELVDVRLAGLSERQREVLSIVAVGEPLGVDLVPGADAPEELDALARRALVRTHRDGRRLQVSLAHPLYGDILRARISPLRTRQLSRTLAELVEGMAARRREDVLRVARWRLDGGGQFQAEAMVVAGQRARSLFDFELAERLVRAAIDAGAGFEAEYLLGELLGLQGFYDDAENHLAALATRADTDRDRTRVALIRMDNLGFNGRVEEALAVLLDAEAAVTDPSCLDQLAVKRAFYAFCGGSTALAGELVEPLLERVDGQALVEACFVAGWTFFLSGRTDDAVAAIDRGLVVHRNLTATFFLWDPAILYCPLTRGLVWSGRLVEAEALVKRCYQEALAREATEPRCWFAVTLADCYRAQGLGETAIRWATEAVGTQRALGRTLTFRNMLIILAGALVVAGRVGDAEAVIAEIDSLTVPMIRWEEPQLIRFRAWVAVARGDRPAAKRLLEEAAGAAARGGDLLFESGALHDLARLGHPRQVAPRLRELAGIVRDGSAPVHAAHAEALACGDGAGLEAASRAFEELGAILLAAEAAADAAVAWRRAGDPRKAAAAERRAHALAARCEGARTPALTAITARAALSARELEIARLASAGVPNKEIAGRLFLSLHTVQNKLHAAYEKLGVQGRAELAEALEEY